MKQQINFVHQIFHRIVHNSAHYAPRTILRKWLSLLVLLLTLGPLQSCDSYLADGVRVVWAKQLFQQGSYQESLLYLFEAEQNRKANFQQEYNMLLTENSEKLLGLRRIQYNIGLVYSALGQSQAAIDLWQFIIDKGSLSKDKTLEFPILYNIGLLYSQTGKDQIARRYLVQALNLEPEHVGVREALELCLEQLKQSDLRQHSQKPNNRLQETAPSQSGISDEQILNYISRQANYRFKRDAKVEQVIRNDW